MRKVSFQSGMVMMFLAVAFFVCAHQADSGITGNANGTKVKRFTGILSGPGAPGSNPFPFAPYIDFICDPLNLNWKIEVIGMGPNKTKVMGHPLICDHIEVVMFYYNPPRSDGINGTAISIKKIP